MAGAIASGVSNNLAAAWGTSLAIASSRAYLIRHLAPSPRRFGANWSRFEQVARDGHLSAASAATQCEARDGFEHRE